MVFVDGPDVIGIGELVCEMYSTFRTAGGVRDIGSRGLHVRSLVQSRRRSRSVQSEVI